MTAPLGPLGHLGSRVSALLDGQLPAREAEAAWEHVHQCPACRELVEREGWIKTQLAGLSMHSSTAVPDRLKGALLGMPPRCLPSHSGAGDDVANGGRARRVAGIAVLGGGAAGAAVMGVLALGAAPVDAPTPTTDRRAPSSQTPVSNPGLPISGLTPIHLTSGRR